MDMFFGLGSLFGIRFINNLTQYVYMHTHIFCQYFVVGTGIFMNFSVLVLVPLSKKNFSGSGSGTTKFLIRVPVNTSTYSF